MEWLNKNGRTQESNGKLVENNPFIPYSIIMDKNAFERIKLIDEKIYTSFPIPIIIREELEKPFDKAKNNFTTYGNIHFFIMFNNHLLDKAELDKMLADIQSRINNLSVQIQSKNDDVEIFSKYKIEIENQTFSIGLYETTEKKLEDYKEQEAQLKKRQIQIRSEKDTLSDENEKNNRLIKQSENLIVKYNIRSEEFDKLCDKYKSYNVNLNSLIRVKNELQELEKKNKAVDNEISDLRNVLMNLKSKRTVFKESINENKIQMERFNSYKLCVNAEAYNNIVPEELEAKYNALTKKYQTL